MVAPVTARELSLPPFTRSVIDLRANRTNGERFESEAGQFFYVESVDLPCRVSFGPNGSDQQSVGLSSGFQMNAPFNGFTLFHDNYTAYPVGASGEALELVLYTSAYPRAFNQYVNPAVQFLLPHYADNVIGGAGPYFTSAFFPILPRARFFNCQSIVFATGTVVDPGYMRSYLYFLDKNAVTIAPPINITRAGYTFNVGTGFQRPDDHPSHVRVAGSTLVEYVVQKFNVAIPARAQVAQLFYQWDTAISSVASNNTAWSI